MSVYGPPAMSEEQIREHDEIDEAARRLWTEHQGLPAIVRAMADSEVPLLADAIWTLAYSLPIRRAIWWGCLCAAHGANVATADEPRLKTAVEWVLAPTMEQQRRATLAAEGDLQTASDWCVKAASLAGYIENDRWTNGMIAAAAGIVRSVAVFAVEGERKRQQNFTYRQAALLGISVGLGEFDWIEPANGPSTTSRQ